LAGRTLNASAVREALERVALDAGFVLGERALAALEDARARETSELGRAVLADLVENARVAREERRPLCQDTGLAVVWIEIGEDVHVEGSLGGAVDEAISAAWREGAFRASVVRDALDRANTDDNTPAAVHVDLVPGDRVRVHFLAKGGGSENQSRSAVLKPAEGRAGVIEFVERAVLEGAPFACPPVVVGVGLGGTADHAAWLAKRALFRPLGEPSDDANTAELERELLERANATGVGPMGLGGVVTALGVHVERAPCHIASLPVAVCLNCHSHRVRSVEL
jgi:fumarate hydratase subunit alpha